MTVKCASKHQRTEWPASLASQNTNRAVQKGPMRNEVGSLRTPKRGGRLATAKALEGREFSRSKPVRRSARAKVTSPDTIYTPGSQASPRPLWLRGRQLARGLTASGTQRTVSSVSRDCSICSSREHHSTSSSMVTTPS